MAKKPVVSSEIVEEVVNTEVVEVAVEEVVDEVVADSTFTTSTSGNGPYNLSFGILHPHNFMRRG